MIIKVFLFVLVLLKQQVPLERPAAEKIPWNETPRLRPHGRETFFFYHYAE